MKIRSSTTRPATQDERNIILAATAQVALYRYSEHKKDTKELFTVNYWRDHFIEQHKERKFAFYSEVSDTLNTRAVAAAIAINKVYSKLYDLPRLQETSGMSPGMFDNFVKEIDKAASSVMTKHALTAAKTGNLVTRFNLATMLAREGNPPEKRQRAYGLLEEIAVNPEIKDSNIRAMALLQMAQLLQEKIIEAKEYLSFDDSLTPKKQEKIIEDKEKPSRVNSSTGKKEKRTVNLPTGFKKKLISDKVANVNKPTTEQYITSLCFNAWMIAEVSPVVPGLARKALEEAIEKSGDSSQTRKELQRFKDLARQKPKPKDGSTQNNGEYDFRLGRVFHSGIKGLVEYKEDEKQAFKWFLQAAEKGHIKAQYVVAMKYENGEGIKEDMSSAYKWYLKAVPKTEAIYRVAQILESKKTKQNIINAFHKYDILAKYGDAAAQYSVARILKNSPVAKPSEDAIFRLPEYLLGPYMWYLKAAQQGYLDAPLIMAEGYLFGNKDIGKDQEEAYKWYLMAAQQGNTRAQYTVAVIFDEDDVVTPSNLEEASKWYKKAFKGYFDAAQQEDADANAQYMVGLMYEKGKGISPNPKEASKWYLKAAQQGEARAQYAVGLMYEQGEGTEKDLTKAFEWYGQAASQGHEDAKLKLDC